MTKRSSGYGPGPGDGAGPGQNADRPRAVLPGKGGRIAGRYQLDELLGEGGIGVVYAGTDTRLGRAVAVKLLRPHLSRRPDARARFVREARVASQLRHPNAVHVFDFGDDDGALFLVMERLIGTTTWHELHAPPAVMPIDRVLRVASCVADVLAAAHAIKLVHRDLKPDNIFVERAGPTERIVVVDFGMAFIAAAKDPGTGRLTEQGLAGGTPEYMSPEQAADVDVGPAADIYSFGCVLFELCTRLAPFRGNVSQLLTAHLYRPPPRLRASRPDAPEALDELCAEMMSKRPVDRPTARAVRRRLAAMQRALDAAARRRALGEARAGAGGALDGSAGAESAWQAAARRPAHETVDEPAPVVPVAVVGDAGADILVALATSRMHPVLTRGPIPSDALAVLALGVDVDGVARLIAHGRPVVADARPEDFGRITELLRAGVASIAAIPLGADDVVCKLRRALARQPDAGGEAEPGGADGAR